MDTLTFIAEIVRTLAWPASSVLLVFMLRKPVGELIPFLRKLKYKEVEIEFSREIADLKANSPSMPEQSILPKDGHKDEPQVSEKLTERLRTKRDELLRMISFSTRVSVMEAWLEVEAAAMEVANSFWSTPLNNSFKNFPRLGEYLLQCKVIDQKQLELLKRLQQLRNKAAHAQELDLGEDDARSYVEIALALATHIRAH